MSGVIYSCVRKTVELVPFFAYKYVQARHLTSNPNPFEEGGGGVKGSPPEKHPRTSPDTLEEEFN